MKHCTLTPAQVAAACEAQSLHEPELHRVWMVRFPGGRVVERRYQLPGVTRSRVLQEHAGATDAEPVTDGSAFTLAARARIRGVE